MEPAYGRMWKGEFYKSREWNSSVLVALQEMQRNKDLWHFPHSQGTVKVLLKMKIPTEQEGARSFRGFCFVLWQHHKAKTAFAVERWGMCVIPYDRCRTRIHRVTGSEPPITMQQRRPWNWRAHMRPGHPQTEGWKQTGRHFVSKGQDLGRERQHRKLKQ